MADRWRRPILRWRGNGGNGNGSVYIADYGNLRIRRVSPDGIINTIAGTGVSSYSGDGGPAVQAQISNPHGLTVGPDGRVFFAVTGNNRVRKISPSGIITTLAGNGLSGFRATAAPPSWPI